MKCRRPQAAKKPPGDPDGVTNIFKARRREPAAPKTGKPADKLPLAER